MMDNKKTFETISVISKNRNKKKDNTVIAKYILNIKYFLFLFFIWLISKQMIDVIRRKIIREK